MIFGPQVDQVVDILLRPNVGKQVAMDLSRSRPHFLEWSFGWGYKIYTKPILRKIKKQQAGIDVPHQVMSKVLWSQYRESTSNSVRKEHNRELKMRAFTKQEKVRSVHLQGTTCKVRNNQCSYQISLFCVKSQREMLQEPGLREGQVRRAMNPVLKTQPIRGNLPVEGQGSKHFDFIPFPPPISCQPLHWLNPAGSQRAPGPCWWNPWRSNF